MSEEYSITCPYCKGIIKTTREHLMKHDRVCCMSCNKAFEVSIDSGNDANKDASYHEGYYGSED